MIFVDPELPVKVHNLLYVTPCSDHPFVKNPHALKFVNQVGKKNRNQYSNLRRIFVNRAPHWPRQISNMDEISPLLARYNFKEFVPDGLSLEAQADVFSSASVVIGIMGAGMTNMVFCGAETPILCLSPDGWPEPFFGIRLQCVTIRIVHYLGVQYLKIWSGLCIRDRSNCLLST